MHNQSPGRPPRRGPDGRSAEQLALAMASFDPSLTAREITAGVNDLIADPVSSGYIARVLQEARSAGKIPRSPRPGPEPIW